MNPNPTPPHINLFGLLYSIGYYVWFRDGKVEIVPYRNTLKPTANFVHAVKCTVGKNYESYKSALVN